VVETRVGPDIFTIDFFRSNDLKEALVSRFGIGGASSVESLRFERVVGILVINMMVGLIM
jgi:hypothetical protein